MNKREQAYNLTFLTRIVFIRIFHKEAQFTVHTATFLAYLLFPALKWSVYCYVFF